MLTTFTPNRNLEIAALKLGYEWRRFKQTALLRRLAIAPSLAAHPITARTTDIPGNSDPDHRNWTWRGSLRAIAISCLSAAPKAIPRTAWGWLAATVFGGVAAAGIVPPVIAYWRLSEVEHRYAALQDNARAVEIYDSKQRLAGIAEISANGSTGHIVLPSKAVPEAFFRIYEALEDKPRNNPLRSYYGIDYVRTGLAFACYGYNRLTRSGDACPGGSTVEQSTARGWNSRFGGMDGRNASDKFAEMLDATSISVIMSRAPERGRVLAADAISYGTAPGGFELWGLRNASLMTFGVEPEKASLAQLAILASMPKWRMAWSCNPNHRFNGDEMEARNKIRERAIYGLQRAFPANDPAALAAVQELRGMIIPAQPAPLSADLIVGLDAQSACLAAANPVNRVQRLMPGESAALRTELRTIEQRYGKVEAIELTADLAEHRIFQATISAVLGEMDRGRGSFGERLVGDGLAADALALGTDANGYVLHIATTSQRDMLNTAVQTGSTGKLVIALAAARYGMSADTPLCERRDEITNVRDAGGFSGFADCSSPDASIDLASAFGESRNLPILQLGRSLPPAIIEQAMRDTGFKLDGNVERSFGLVTGLSMNSPARVAATQLAIANGIAGKPATAFVPTVIARVRVNGRWIVPERASVDLQAYFSTPMARAYMATAATAAVSNPRGTLRGILNGEPAVLETAKSGTVPGPRPMLATRIKWGSGALAGRGAWVSLIAARRTYVGNASFSSIPLSRSTRDAVMRDTVGPKE